jgi:predicted nuclease of predicted toxin-antitoxin system
LILRVLLDENIPPSVCAFVRNRKPAWVVQHVTDVGLRGAPDNAIFRWAQIDGSLVITFDEDFADARMYPTGSHAGVIRLRVWPTTVENTEAALGRLFDSVADDDLRESLVIVDQRRIRIRRSARHG